MKVQLALYKGPPSSDNLKHFITHYAICIRSLSKYSHCELVIDGVSYSSSARDGGVRKKTIIFDQKWDIIDLPRADAHRAIEIFELKEDNPYDWMGIVSFILPFVKHSKDKEFCSEIVAEMLCIDPADKCFPGDLKKLTKHLQ